jgi:deoxyhypusine synthase
MLHHVSCVSSGDMLFFHSYKSPGLVVDVVQDIRAINDSAMRASPRRTGMIILGGGEHKPLALAVAPWLHKLIAPSAQMKLCWNALADYGTP